MESSKYKSIILPQAERDIFETMEYITNELCNPTAAKNLFSEIAESVERISVLPYAMPTIKNNEITLGKEYHWTSVKNFLLIYKIVEEQKEIRIMAFLYGKSDVISKLIERL